MGIGSLIKKAWNATFNVGPDAKDMYIAGPAKWKYVSLVDKGMGWFDKYPKNKFLNGLEGVIKYNPLSLVALGVVKGIDIASGDSRYVDKYLEGIKNNIAGGSTYGGLVSKGPDGITITLDNYNKTEFPKLSVRGYKSLAMKLGEDLKLVNPTGDPMYIFRPDGYFKNLR